MKQPATRGEKQQQEGERTTDRQAKEQRHRQKPPQIRAGERLTIKRTKAIIGENIAEGKGVGDAAAARGTTVSKTVSALVTRDADMRSDMVKVNREIISAN